jgi:hypothetical protein
MNWGHLLSASALVMQEVMTMNKRYNDNNLVKHKYKLWSVCLPISFTHIRNYADTAGRMLYRHISADKLPLQIYHHKLHQNRERIYCE